MTNHGQRSRTLEPLRNGRSAGTLRLQLLMEVQQRHEIGQRIKELRNASPQTNRSIADHVGVGERAVAQWIAGGGIAWENAKKVAELFEVEVQWLWTGRDKDATPDLLAQLDGGLSERLDRIEERLAENQDGIIEILNHVDAGFAAADVSVADLPSAQDEQTAAQESASRGRSRRARG